MLPLDTLFALIIFAFVASITPGPNNLMLLASGVNFGFWRTVPHMLGVGLGFVFMVVVIGLGLGQLFALFPWLYLTLKAIGAIYMVWLAWKLANTASVGDGTHSSTPMTFMAAAAFQWVNPKAWAMAVSATATYTIATDFALSVLVVAGVFGLVNLPSVSSWALFGVWLRRFLSNAKIVRLFNTGMAILLIGSLWPLVAEFALH